MKSGYYVYILASKRNGTLYIGMTNDLPRRMIEHKEGKIKGFTAKYGVHKLVYTECYATPAEAIWREKCMKKWNRTWKLRAIESTNPDWNDLFEALV